MPESKMRPPIIRRSVRSRWASLALMGGGNKVEQDAGKRLCALKTLAFSGDGSLSWKHPDDVEGSQHVVKRATIGFSHGLSHQHQPVSLAGRLGKQDNESVA